MRKPIVAKKGSSFCIDGSGSQFISKSNEFLVTQEVLGRSSLTVRSYAYDLLYLYRWIIKSKVIFKDLSERNVVHYITIQRQNNQAPSSINRRLSTLELFYRFCFEKSAPGTPDGKHKQRKFHGYDRALGLFQIRKNIYRGLRVKEPERLIDPLSILEVRQFLKSVSNYRDISIVLLMLLCGLRSREVIGVEINKISFSSKIIRVTGKGNKERELPLPDQILSPIQKYLKYERPAFSNSQKLFLNLKGKKRGASMSPSGIRSLFRYKRNKSGVKRANPHRFRHTFGKDMATQGVHLSSLQKMMGHADHSTTMKYIRLQMTDIHAEYNEAIKRIQDEYDKC